MIRKAHQGLLCCALGNSDIARGQGGPWSNARQPVETGPYGGTPPNGGSPPFGVAFVRAEVILPVDACEMHLLRLRL
jgi:hypothetical protein